eukprot:7447335-Ditylum_brightwellii.AAC.1
MIHLCRGVDINGTMSPTRPTEYFRCPGISQNDTCSSAVFPVVTCTATGLKQGLEKELVLRLCQESRGVGPIDCARDSPVAFNSN